MQSIVPSHAIESKGYEGSVWPKRSSVGPVWVYASTHIGDRYQCLFSGIDQAREIEWIVCQIFGVDDSACKAPWI